MNKEEIVNTGSLARIAFERRIPYQATIELLTQCNLACEHCYIPNHTSSGMPFDKVIDLLNELKLMGTLELLLTGGEIFLRKDIMDIIRHARKIGMRVSLFSNATIVNEDYLRELKDLYIEEFSCTIFSMDADIHDSITGSKGSLYRTLHCMELVKKYGLHGGVKTVVMKKNYDSWKAIYEYCQQNGFNYIAPASIMPKIDGDTSPLAFQLNYEEMKSLYEEESKYGLEEVNRVTEWNAEDYICDALQYSVYIDCAGNVYPCNSFYYKVGNIYHTDLRQIWNVSPEHKYVLSLRKKDLIDCHNCHYKQYCAKCPGNSLFENGNPLSCSTTDYNNAKINAGGE